MVSTSRGMGGSSLRVVVLLVAAVLLGFSHASAQLTATWVDNSGGMATTRIERRLDTDTSFTALTDVPPGITMYVDGAVTTGLTYCYRAFAWDADGVSPYSAEACATAGASSGFRVSVSKTGTGSGTVTSTPAAISCGSTCAATFTQGTLVTLTAAPAPGSTFDGWTGGGCAGTAPCTIATNTNVAITASFSLISYPLTVTTSGSGIVASSPTGINCGSTCSASYAGGIVVTLTPTPLNGTVFAGWSGACTGTSSCSVTMNAPSAVTATFRVPLFGQCSTPTGEVGVAYNASCTATGGTAPYSCTLASGALPAGVSLAGSCGIAGTPTAAGTSAFTVRVTDVVGSTLDVNGSLTILSAVTVTTATLPTATVSQSYSTTLGATGGKTPYAWSVTAGVLPAGLTLNASTGVISGVPTTAGTSTFTVQVRDGFGATSARAQQLTVSLGPLTASCTLASGEVGVGYSGACTPKAGLPPYSCSLKNGPGGLPAGVALNTDCSLTGTPTTAGTSSFTVRVSDSGGALVNVGASLTILARVALGTSTLPNATVSASYSTTLAASGGKTPYTWSVTSGALPAGLALNTTTGAITGIPTALGTSTFTVQVRDALGGTAQQALQLTVTTATTSYTLGVTTSGSGTVTSTPAGISCGSTCSASYNGGTVVALTATPSSGSVFAGWGGACTGTAGCSVTMDAAAAVTASFRTVSGQCTTPTGEVGISYTAGCTATGGTAPYSCAMATGTLPAGLTLASNCGIGGTPTAAGTSTFTVRMTDAIGGTLTVNGSLTIVSAVSVTTVTLPGATVGQSYSTTVAATGGKTPYTWTLTSGALPAGLALNTTTGAITGTPTAVETSTLTVRATDALGGTAQQALQLSVSDGSYLLSVTTSGSGTVTSTPAGISCGSTCSAGFTRGAVVTLSATPMNGWIFAGWGGGCSGTAGCSVTLNAPAAVTATFRVPLSGQCSTPAGQIGLAYSAACTVSGGVAPYTCHLASGTLPAGLSLGLGCDITGTPTTAGTSSFTVRVIDGVGSALDFNASVTILAPLSVTTATLANGTVSQSYSTTLAGSGGKTPYTWSVTSGALPAGLALNTTTGAIAGTPTAVGTSAFTVQVRDALGGTALRPLQIVVNLGPLSGTCTPPAGAVDIPYSQACKPAGGLPSYTCSLVSGTPPTGLALNSDCTITGTPTAAGTSSFTVRMTDAVGSTLNVNGSVTILSAVTVTTATLPTATVSQSYSTTLGATGGKAPYAWSVTAGALPAGLTLNASTGVISGVPTTAGTSAFTVQVRDGFGATSARAQQLTVSLGPLTASCTLAPGEVGVAYTGACTPQGGLPPSSCSLASGNLPAGLTLKPDCSITGTPTTAGSSTFTVRVADSGGATVTTTPSLSILAGVALGTSTLPNATLSASYSTTLAASGGKTPYTWSVTSGALPAGLALNTTTGAITGIPTALGTSTFTVQVRDALGATAFRSLQVVVNLGPLSGTCTPPAGTVDVPYSQACKPTGGLPSYTCSLVSGTPPAGLTLNSDCTITGIPTGVTSSFMTRIADSAGSSVNVSSSVTIAPHVTITTSALPIARLGLPYSTTLAVSNGVKPFAWSVVAGRLPAGLALNAATGAITGTPTSLGVSDVTFRVTDALGAGNSRALQAVVNLGPLSATCTMPVGEAAMAYAGACNAAGGLPPYSCALASGTLPDGLTLNSDCTLTGTPTVGGTKSFTARISDSGGLAINVASSIAIQPHVSVATTALPKAWLNHSYTTTLAAAGGIKPFTWAVVGGALPAGLSLNPTTGALTGIGTVLGVKDVVFQVTDARGATGSRTLQMVVNLGNLTGTCTMPAGEADIAYSGACTPVAGLPPYSCALASGTLPDGLTVNSNCTITGTPTVAGTKSFTTRISDSGGLAINVATSIAIQPHVSVATTTLPKASVNHPYTTTLAAAGGIKPFAWSISAGSLPAGFTLNPSTGAITGNATALGIVSFTARVTDGLGSVGERTLQIVTNLGALTATCTMAGAEVGIPYSGSCQPAGGLPPYSCAVTSGSLPTGLTLNSNCSITGTPVVAEAPAFTATISDSGLLSVGVAGRITVVPHVAVGTTTLPVATVNRAYTTTLAATGGVKPLTWSVIGGSLPAGIVLNPTTGTLSGMAMLAGINDVTLQVADAYGATGTATLRLVVYAGPLGTRCSSGEVGVPYAGCTISGGMPGYSCTLASGTLPVGLTLRSDCSITGVPYVVATSTFALSVIDGSGASATLPASISVLPAVDITTGVLSSGTISRAYSATLRASGGKTAYTWSLVSGALPVGLTLNPTTGAITGTPSESGGSAFTVRVTDALGGTDEQKLFLAIQ